MANHGDRILDLEKEVARLSERVDGLRREIERATEAQERRLQEELKRNATEQEGRLQRRWSIRIALLTVVATLLANIALKFVDVSRLLPRR